MLRTKREELACRARHVITIKVGISDQGRHRFFQYNRRAALNCAHAGGEGRGRVSVSRLASNLLVVFVFYATTQDGISSSVQALAMAIFFRDRKLL